MHMMRSWDAKTDTTLCRKMYIYIQVKSTCILNSCIIFRSLFTSSSRQVCHFLQCIENYMIFLKILTHSADRSSTLVYLVKFDPDLNIIIMYLCFRSCTQWSILGFFSSYYFWLCSRGAPKHISGIASLIIVVIFQLIRPYLASSKRKDQQTLIRKSDCCSCVATASGNKTYYPMLQTIRKINRRALLKLKSCKVAHLLKLSC